jgi:hypothetical protein
VSGVREVKVNGGEDVCGRCEGFDGFVTEVCRDGLPAASVVTFQK